MSFRIGINVGDVMVIGEDIFGDGINVAARVQSLTDPGGVCVTRAVRDQLRDRVEIRFEDLGEHAVKNIARPIRVFRALFDVDAEPALPNRTTEGDKRLPEARSEQEEESDSVEIAFWQSVQASDDDAEYRIYLDRYPEGAFAELARARLRGASAIDDKSIELAYWETVRDTNDPAMLQAYLEKYPAGEFRRLAEIKLAQFRREPSSG